jgi:hypothetical protein
MDATRAADLPMQRQQVYAQSVGISEQFPPRISPELWAMVGPRAAFRHLARSQDSCGAWVLLRRPLFLTFLIGCTFSLGTAGVLTARLVFSIPASWSFVPLFEIVSLCIVCWRRRRTIPISRTVDLFFTGHGPWIVALLGLGAITSWMSPLQANSLIRLLYLWVGFPFLLLTTIWSAYIDFFFFRIVMELPTGNAARHLLVQRAIAWSCGIAYLFAFPLWPLIVGWFRP